MPQAAFSVRLEAILVAGVYTAGEAEHGGVLWLTAWKLRGRPGVPYC